MARLRVYETEAEFRDWPVAEHGVKLGWDATGPGDIRLPKVEFISRLHAEILPHPKGGWQIHDRSSNGTSVDGVRIQGIPARLRDGAALDFAGAIRAVFYLDGPRRDDNREEEKREEERRKEEKRDDKAGLSDVKKRTPSWLLRDLRSGANLIRNHAGSGSVRVQKLRLSLEALARAVQDPDPETARAALTKELDRRGVLSKELQNLDEVFRDLLLVLDSFDKKITQAEDEGR